MRKLHHLFGAALILGTLGLSHAADAADPVKVRIAWVSAPGTIIPLVFDEAYRNADLLKHYGKSYTVETTLFRGSAPQITAVAANEIDIIQPAFSSLVFTIENAKLTDIRVIGDIFQSGVGSYLAESYMVRGDGGIDKVEDLKGKTVATNAFGGALDIAMQAMLKKHGLTQQRDYTAVEIQIPNMVSDLVGKKVDMISVGMPWTEDAKKAGGKALFKMRDSMGIAQEIMMASRTGFLEKNHAAMNDMMEDYVRALQWFFNPANRTAALALISKFNKRPASDYESYVLTEKDYYRDPYAVPNVEALQKNIDLVRELGFGKTTIDVKKYVDLSFVEEAKKRLGGATPPGWQK